MPNSRADFRNLVVWRRSHQLTLEIYRLSRQFPYEERFGLTAQLRRAMSAIPTNLAEGCSRRSLRSYAASVDIALGSAGEVDYQLLLSRDLEYLAPSAYESTSGEIDEIRRMLAGLYSSLRQ